MKTKKNIQISENFTLFEMLYSDKALELGLVEEQHNITEEILINLELLIMNVLQPARSALELIIKVLSGYRCKKVNQAIDNSSKTSDHMEGKAADITSVNNYLLFKYIRDNLQFKQLIWYEYGDGFPRFIHVSYDKDNNKKEVLICHCVVKDGKESRTYTKL